MELHPYSKHFGGENMYTDSAYWHNKTPDIDDNFEDNSVPLIVSSCGVYRMYTRQKLLTYRPRGRLDYQLLYVVSGRAHFYFNGVKEIVPAGNMIIYRPGEMQHYYYCGSDKAEVHWMHFTGASVRGMLEKYGLTDDVHTIYVGTSMEYKRLFQQALQELKLCKEDYEEVLANNLQNLLIGVHRAISSKLQGDNQVKRKEMDEAVHYFHMNYNKAINIEEYAESIHMSVRWFIRNFREYTGTTPAQYIVSLRIFNAQTLLKSTDYNITEIASIVGYDNPFYFSRLFRKQSGETPSEYRKKFRT